MSTESDEITAAFKLICKKCGSENVVVNFELGHNYGGETGYEDGSLTIGCNDCKRNDVLVTF